MFAAYAFWKRNCENVILIFNYDYYDKFAPWKYDATSTSKGNKLYTSKLSTKDSAIKAACQQLTTSWSLSCPDETKP
jgi:hypothetical protein